MTAGDQTQAQRARTARTERSELAVRAAAHVARRHGLRVEEPVVLADMFSLMVHLRPAPVVARVATFMPKLRSPIEDWLGMELAVTSFLAEQGAPVVSPSRELSPGPHAHDGLAISFWTYLEPDPERTPTRADCAAMLADLHSVLAGYPGELPMLGANDIPRGLEIFDKGSDFLDGTERQLVKDAAERLLPFIEAPGGELRPLHGDAHPGNIMATRGGLVWIDFEDVCRGPAEWDMATIGDPEAIAAHHSPDSALMATCTKLRALQVTLALVAFREEFGDLDGWDLGVKGMLEWLASLPDP